MQLNGEKGSQGTTHKTMNYNTMDTHTEAWCINITCRVTGGSNRYSLSYLQHNKHFKTNSNCNTQIPYQLVVPNRWKYMYHRQKNEQKNVSVLKTNISRKDWEGESRLLVNTSNLTGSGLKLDRNALDGVTIHYLHRKARYIHLYVSVHANFLSEQQLLWLTITVRGWEEGGGGYLTKLLIAIL